MARKNNTLVEEEIIENIHSETLEEIMGDRFATYAKYVIQDRAIPDARDGLKPVQRRIIYAMYKAGNIFARPTVKCAHTVGKVMGEYHPHGDSSIYEALVRMSQDWKNNNPLIAFQGNNGSIDGDGPAAYRYTESKLSQIAEEMIRDIDKDTVDMALTFDDSSFEPVVLPSRFPNLLVNGTEGIAVGMATDIPTHNLKEVIEAIIYRINHVRVEPLDLMQFIKGPDFPGGGIIYSSNGLTDMYTQGRGRIEIAAKAEVVDTPKEKAIIVTEIPYKTVKIDLVHEIDMLRHNNDESDEATHPYYYLGGSKRRWKTLYIYNSAIETSDRKQKTDIEVLNEKYVGIFDLIDPVSYKLKGGDRLHTGFIAQDVEDAMNEVGLTIEELGLLCKDLDVDDDGNTILDDDGNEQYNYGLRYGEFVAILSAKIKQLEAEIKELKGE